MKEKPLDPDSTWSIEDAAVLGAVVQQVRRARGLTQADLAAASGTGRRFIIELERGKPTCRLGPSLRVLRMLGLDLELRAR